MEGGIYLEAKGLGVVMRKPFLPTENPSLAADNLVYGEDKIRKSLFSSWKLKENNNFD
tara:strand:+ start:365 stop:538 length:174 start_codon:yes stop_codon:yes gene_type:complete